MKPTDLRGILQYVPAFRDRVFVLALDGAIVAHENFANLLLDVAVLRSLNIRVVLVHGAGAAIEAEAAKQRITPSDLDGCGVTDDATLDVSVSAANRLAHDILKGLAANDLRAVNSNCITASPLGIIKGVDHENTGKVERVDDEFLNNLLADDCVPVIPPLGTDGAGATYRVNSDAVAVAVAKALKATKLLFATSTDGISSDNQILRQASVEELKSLPNAIPSSKAANAIQACEAGIPRVHVINGLVDEGLLAEVFSNEGIGTLIYGNEYQAIRQAKKSDIRTLRRITRAAVENDELLKRTRVTMEQNYGDYFIYEIDNNPIGCVALHQYAEAKLGELAFLYVSPSHENQGIGRKLMQYVETQAQERGLQRIIALSTQAFAFLKNKGGFAEGDDNLLPSDRKAIYEQSGRKSRILYKDLA